MAQFGRPLSDVSNSGWTGTPTPGNMWSNIDEVTPSDTDYCFGANNSNGSNFEVALSGFADPVDNVNHIVRYRHGKTQTGTLNGAGGSVTLTVSLYQGATLIASTSVGVTGSWTDGSLTLSGAEADSITDYNDLRLRFSQSGSGGGPNARGAAVSWAEIEIPDPPISAQADLEIVKTVDNPTPVVNTNVNFTITCSNLGPDSADNVVVDDILPSGYDYVSKSVSKGTYDEVTGIWSIGTMANSDAETLEITATVLSTGSYNNVAEAFTDTFDPDPINNIDNASVNPIFPDFRLQDKLEAILIGRADTVNSISFVQTVDNTSTFYLVIDTFNLTAFFNDGDISDLIDYLLTALYELEESIVVGSLHVFDGASSLLEQLRFTIYFDYEETLFEEMIAPATPDADSIVIYVDNADAELKYKDEAGNITNL